jgi:hypothetical protein
MFENSLKKLLCDFLSLAMPQFTNKKANNVTSMLNKQGSFMKIFEEEIFPYFREYINVGGKFWENSCRASYFR